MADSRNEAIELVHRDSAKAERLYQFLTTARTGRTKSANCSLSPKSRLPLVT